MNTLDDLRATFERETAFDDTERTARPTAVRARIRTARRRRAGAMAVAAAVALVVATGTTALVRGPEDPEPARPELEDVHVPQRIDVLGAPYRLTDTRRAAADGSIRLTIGYGGTPVASLVATGLGSGEATLWSGPWPVARVRGDQQLSAPVPVGSNLRIELDGAPRSARAEVAIYDPTGEPAPGVAEDGVVFVQRYGDRELVGATFAHAGEDATVEVPDAAGDLEVSAYCHSETAHLWLHREGTTGGFRCADLGAVEADQLLAPQHGERSLTAYVTKGKDGPRATDIDVTFGVALYRQAVAPTRVLGQEVASVLDFNGRTWRLDDVLAADGDEYEVDTSRGDVFIGAAYIGAASGFLSWRGAPEGGWTGFADGDEPQSGVLNAGVLLAGDHTVRLHLAGPDAEGRLLVYRPL